MKDFPNHPGMVQCVMNGRLYVDSCYGIWDDGEWISWDYINDHLEEVELLAEYPGASIDAIEAFEDLLDAARRYRDATGRFLEIWGELGEVYAELKFGVKRHAAYQSGSDGILGGEAVEIKTLAPTRRRGDSVQVKSAGDFTRLIVVKISESLEFEAKIIDRTAMRCTQSTILRTRWSDHDIDSKDPTLDSNRWGRMVQAAQAAAPEED